MREGEPGWGTGGKRKEEVGGRGRQRLGEEEGRGWGRRKEEVGRRGRKMQRGKMKDEVGGDERIALNIQYPTC